MANMKSNSNHTSMVLNRKEKRRRLRVGDPGFKPPDGGWGWLIVVTCGIGNLCSFPMFHQFGLVFKNKFAMLGIGDSQTLTIINLCVAFNTGVGLLNGPIFRLFSQRQVALVSALGVVISLIVLSNCVSFWSHLVMYSICYGASFGLLESANSLAINTYFEEKRRSATGYSWTLTGLGPIVCPHIIVFLESFYGVNGVVFLFAGFAMHSFVCGLFLQPVEWHTQYEEMDVSNKSIEPNKSIDESNKITRDLVNANQFFSNEGYCASESNSPVMPPKLANHGTKDLYGDNIIASREGLTGLPKDVKQSINTTIQNECNVEDDDVPQKQQESGTDTVVRDFPEKRLEKAVDGVSSEEEPPTVEFSTKTIAKSLQDIREANKNIWTKLYEYFDIELLKDPTYIILNLGLTFANVTEMNFSLATPLILSEFNFDTYQTANYMSLLAATDLVVRFISSVLADKIGWSNRVYFLIGILSMALGRIILVHTQSYPVGMFVAIIIGTGKALRTIFMILVIPSHVSLERLPAAYGLQFAVSGITFVILGPVVGWIRDQSGTYVITLHILNVCTYLTAISWTIDSWITSRKKKNELDTKSIN
ncbi:hypothetical protein JTB14_018792 [Gonioctena quinquepunctata]|nr:hypothetical protein JTB14_018792 [Gonioctena quinquepunctata]